MSPPCLNALRTVRHCTRDRRACQVGARFFKCACFYPLYWAWKLVRCLILRIASACVDQVLVYVTMAILIVYFISSEASARLGTPTLSETFRIEDPGMLIYQKFIQHMSATGYTNLTQVNPTGTLSTNFGEVNHSVSPHQSLPQTNSTATTQLQPSSNSSSSSSSSTGGRRRLRGNQRSNWRRKSRSYQ